MVVIQLLEQGSLPVFQAEQVLIPILIKLRVVAAGAAKEE